MRDSDAAAELCIQKLQKKYFHKDSMKMIENWLFWLH